MADKPTVVEALAAVMGDVQGIAKKDRNTQQSYSFRGVDATMNAVGPAFRAHNVVCVPISTVYDAEHFTTKNGANMRGVTLTVTFRFYGPAGDYIDAQVCGESADAGDKAVPKAHSVAYRTLLLQALCIPTDEPDPDSQSHERAATRVGGADAAAVAGSEPRGASSEPTAPANTPDDELATKAAVLGVGLLALAKQLGAEEATKKAIEDNKAKGDPAGHIAWLDRCIATAEENLRTKESSFAAMAESAQKKAAAKKKAA